MADQDAFDPTHALDGWRAPSPEPPDLRLTSLLHADAAPDEPIPLLARVPEESDGFDPTHLLDGWRAPAPEPVDLQLRSLSHVDGAGLDRDKMARLKARGYEMVDVEDIEVTDLPAPRQPVLEAPVLDDIPPPPVFLEEATVLEAQPPAPVVEPEPQPSLETLRFFEEPLVEDEPQPQPEPAEVPVAAGTELAEEAPATDIDAAILPVEPDAAEVAGLLFEPLEASEPTEPDALPVVEAEAVEPGLEPLAEVVEPAQPEELPSEVLGAAVPEGPALAMPAEPELSVEDPVATGESPPEVLAETQEPPAPVEPDPQPLVEGTLPVLQEPDTPPVAEEMALPEELAPEVVEAVAPQAQAASAPAEPEPQSFVEITASAEAIVEPEAAAQDFQAELPAQDKPESLPAELPLDVHAVAPEPVEPDLSPAMEEEVPTEEGPLDAMGPATLDAQALLASTDFELQQPVEEDVGLPAAPALDVQAVEPELVGTDSPPVIEEVVPVEEPPVQRAFEAASEDVQVLEAPQVQAAPPASTEKVEQPEVPPSAELEPKQPAAAVEAPRLDFHAVPPPMAFEVPVLDFHLGPPPEVPDPRRVIEALELHVEPPAPVAADAPLLDIAALNPHVEADPRLLARWQPQAWMALARQVADASTEVLQSPAGLQVKNHAPQWLCAAWPPQQPDAPWLGRWPELATLVEADTRDQALQALLGELPAEANLWAAEQAPDWGLVAELVLQQDVGLRPTQARVLRELVETERSASQARLSSGYQPNGRVARRRP